MKTRKEFDSIGGINVPNDKYWGASTQRSMKFFNIGKIFVPTPIIRSIAIIKRSAAIVHKKDKLISLSYGGVKFQRIFNYKSKKTSYKLKLDFSTGFKSIIFLFYLVMLMVYQNPKRKVRLIVISNFSVMNCCFA